MRRWGWLVGLALVAAARPQEISDDDKTAILNGIHGILTESAFVPGVDFEKWSTFLEARQSELNQANEKRRFVQLLNRTLREFGVSHISVAFAKRTEGSGGLAQEPNPFKTPGPHELDWIDDRTVRLRLRTFGESYDRKGIEQSFVEAAKADKMILDLRGNGGGAVSNLQHFLSLLLPPKTEVGTMVSRRLARSFQELAHGDPTDGVGIARWTDRKFRTAKLSVEPFKGKVVVLTSRGSASASEICAAALRENKGSQIVGARTAGAVLVSRIFRLPAGLEIKVPTADFYTSKYLRLEGNPLAPDAEADVMSTDACVKKAIELFTKVN